MNARNARSRRGTLSLTEAALFFAVALAVRALTIAVHDFDGAYGQDAWAYIERAYRLRATGFALQPYDPGYTLPVLFPFMIAAMMAVVGPIVAAGQTVAVLCGALTASVMAAITRALFPRAPAGAAWIAAALVAFSGQHVTWSTAAMSDTPAALFFAVSMLALARAQRVDTFARWMVLAGLALGIAWSTRWSYVAVAPAFAAAWIVSTRAVNGLSPGMWTRSLAAVGAGIIACLPQLIVTLRHPRGLGIGWSGDWSPANIFVRSFYFAEGQYDYTWPMGIYYLLPVVHPGWLSPIVGLFAVVGGWQAWKKRTMLRNQLALCLCAGGAAASWLMLAGMPHQNFRYGMQVWLPLVPLAAVAMTSIRRWPALRKKTAVAAVGLSAAMLLTWTIRAPSKLVELAHVHRDTALELVDGLPADARIWALGPTASLRHRTDRHVEELFRLSPADVDRVSKSERPLYTIYDHEAVARWRHGDLPKTMAALAALRKSRGAESIVIATHTRWHLIGIGTATGVNR